MCTGWKGVKSPLWWAITIYGRSTCFHKSGPMSEIWVLVWEHKSAAGLFFVLVPRLGVLFHNKCQYYAFPAFGCCCKDSLLCELLGRLKNVTLRWLLNGQRVWNTKKMHEPRQWPVWPCYPLSDLEIINSLICICVCASFLIRLMQEITK